MKLIIDIPEKTVNEIKDNAMFAETIASQIKWGVTSAIVNAKPLDDLRAEINRKAVYYEAEVNTDIASGMYKTIDIIDKYRGSDTDEMS